MFLARRGAFCGPIIPPACACCLLHVGALHRINDEGSTTPDIYGNCATQRWCLVVAGLAPSGIANGWKGTTVIALEAREIKKGATRLWLPGKASLSSWPSLPSSIAIRWRVLESSYEAPIAEISFAGRVHRVTRFCPVDLIYLWTRTSGNFNRRRRRSRSIRLSFRRRSRTNVGIHCIAQFREMRWQ